MKPVIVKRIMVFVIGYLVSSVSAAFFCSAPCSKLFVWLGVHLGPFSAFTTASGPTTLDDWIVWFAIVVFDIICILAYLFRANLVTGILTILGIAGGFYSGVMGIESAV